MISLSFSIMKYLSREIADKIISIRGSLTKLHTKNHIFFNLTMPDRETNQLTPGYPNAAEFSLRSKFRTKTELLDSISKSLKLH